MKTRARQGNLQSGLAAGKGRAVGSPGKRTRVETRYPARARDDGWQARVDALVAEVAPLGAVVAELRFGGEQAREAASIASGLVPRVAAQVAVLRGAEAQLRAADMWPVAEPLIAAADELVREAEPLMAAARPPKDDAIATAPRGGQGAPPYTPTSEFDLGPAMETAPEENFVESMTQRAMPGRHPFRGIELFLVADQSIIRYARVNTSGEHGPREAGPYRMHAYLGEGDVVLCFGAFHAKRQQTEWMVGPDKLAEFVSSADFYAGVATKAYPGSVNVPESRSDGADGDPHLPSDEELRRVGKLTSNVSLTPDLSAATPDMAGGVYAEHGGSALNSARNSLVRLRDYEIPARKIADDVLKKMNSGELDHLVAREQAVEQRNVLMRKAREKLSPGARAASRFAKDDAGKSVEELVERNIRKMISESGFEGDKLAKLRAAQAADSELWAQYKAALVNAENTEAVYHSAIRELGGSPLVSRRIIDSASRPNPKVTALVRLGKWGGAILGAKGLYDLAYEIVTADEGERFVVASQGISGFAGGIIGAEAGQAGATWLASLVLEPEAVLAVTVIGMVGAVFGGDVGGSVGAAVPAMAGMAAGEVIKDWLPSSTMSTEGGFEGLVEREQAQHQPHSLSYRIEGAMIDLDFQIHDLEHRIETAPDRAQMEMLQKLRIEALRKRGELDAILPEVRQLEKQQP